MPDTTFIWKYENEKDTLADDLDNVYLGDWLPQNELLGEKRLRFQGYDKDKRCWGSLMVCAMPLRVSI